jgi:hypothetical protein
LLRSASLGTQLLNDLKIEHELVDLSIEPHRRKAFPPQCNTTAILSCQLAG